MKTDIANAPITRRTLFDKVWDRHVVFRRDDGQCLLYVDRHYIHEGAMVSFAMLTQRGLGVRRPDRTFGIPDHFVPTRRGRSLADLTDPEVRAMVDSIEQTAPGMGIPIYRMADPRQGIVHVVGPEQGLTLPGALIACGDSHTATHGALGALAFGIGSTEVAHVLATQTMWHARPRTMRVTVDGALGTGVGAKDLVLAVIGRIGAHGAVGHVIEYAGSAIRSLSVEGRMTVCNMSIEAGARAGLIAADDKTFAYVEGRPYAPNGPAWDRALAEWRCLVTDDGAHFDREVRLDAADLQPMVTWGHSPDQSAPIGGRVPTLAEARDATQRANWQAAMDYMGLVPGMAIQSLDIDHVFIGSCTNSRIEDLRSAARVVAGRVAKVPAWVVPGSGLVKRQAEAEGLDRVFRSAGFEWREPGCSMCVGMNGDTLAAGQRCASTSNRNFAGRQGKGVRTHLVSPAMAAAAAIRGHLADVRLMLEGQ